MKYSIPLTNSQSQLNLKIIIQQYIKHLLFLNITRVDLSVVKFFIPHSNSQSQLHFTFKDYLYSQTLQDLIYLSIPPNTQSQLDLKIIICSITSTLFSEIFEGHKFLFYDIFYASNQVRRETLDTSVGRLEEQEGDPRHPQVEHQTGKIQTSFQSVKKKH